jgi:hypothetical protein
MAGWQLSDAWVFAAIEGRSVEDGYSLTQIIAKADGINHAILEEDEFTRAIPRLVNAGLVGADLDADRYWHTDAGHDLYARRMKRHGLFGWTEALPPALRRLGPPQDGTWVLPHGTFQAAVDEWHRRADEILARLTPSGRRKRHRADRPATD